MRRLVFLAPLVLFVPGFLAMILGGGWTWFLPVFTFVVLPLTELVLPPDRVNLDAEGEATALRDRTFDLLVWAIVPTQLLLLGAYLWRLSVGGLASWELAGTVFTMGIACGVYGINVGHELGHRRAPFEQTLAKILLGTSLYAHFFVEHNRGHHRRVATPDDPASAREGETVYGFWLRSVVQGWRSAWKLENDRLEREGVAWWSWQNEMVRLTTYQGAAVLGVGLALGVAPMLGFVVAATIGFLLLETVNYLEHYGLQRGKTERGVYERVQPWHSWNSDRPVGRAFLFDLPRHSDHHANATRKYQILRHFDGAPELPAGYPAMIVLAMVPPIFKAVMGRALVGWRAQYGARSQVA